jgi:Flp pilus assembly protein TadG
MKFQRGFTMLSISQTASKLRGLSRDKRGNVLIIMGFALIPITLAAGMSVDYTRAARLKTKLDAAADAAVLAAVAEAANDADDKTVCERAAALFDSQAQGIPETIYNRATSLTLTVGSASTPSNVTYIGSTNNCSTPAGSPSSAASRVVSLSYMMRSSNIFGSLLGKPSIEVSGRAGSEASIAPNIDFYVALDTSPSMALPVTTAGITAMTSTTGCTFACHTNQAPNTVQDNATYALNKSAPRTGTIGGNPITYIDAADTYVYTNGNKCTTSGSVTTCTADKNVYNSDGSFVDTYWYTRNKGITLRIDELRRATSDLVTTARTEADKADATYQGAIYAFDYEANFRKVFPAYAGVMKIAEKTPSALTLANGDAFKAAATNPAMVDLARLDDKSGGGCPAVGCDGTNRYLFTSYKGLFDGMMATGVLPATGGNGTRLVTDTPQAILFIVTDGMSGEKSSLVDGVYSNPHGYAENRTRSEMSGSLPSPGSSTHMAKCNAIKARNIRIAILYTEYTSASIASDEPEQRGWVNSRIPNVEGKLRDCASPGLLITVSEGSDISAALSRLFKKAIATPRLVR